MLPSLGSSLRSLIDRLFDTAGVDMNVVAEADSIATSLAMVASGSAHAILSTGLESQLDARQCESFRLRDPAARRNICLCWPSSGVADSEVMAIRRSVVDACNAMVVDGSWSGAAIAGQALGRKRRRTASMIDGPARLEPSL